MVPLSENNRQDILQIGSIFLARSAIVAGDVQLADDCNIWHYVVIRGDVAPIRLGERVNVQDGALLHCRHGVPLEIAADSVVSHHAVVHCTRVGSRSLVGTKAVLLDDCEVGDDCIIAAGAVVPPRTIIPDGSVVMGVPGKIVRPIKPEERDYIRLVIETYQRLAREHVAGQYPPYSNR